MSRNKKRVQIKKKRAMRRVRRNDNSSRVQTPEQKAKENEMLKLLLGRQMTTPQQNQQHDKQQEKIEQLNKLIYEEQRKASNYEQELKEKNKILDDIRTGKKEIMERERSEQQRRQLQDAQDKVDFKKAEYDLATEAGRAKQQIDELEEEYRQLGRELNDLEKQQKSDKIQQAVNEAKERRDKIQLELTAQREYLESPEWTNRQNVLIETLKEEANAKFDLEQARLIAEHKQRIMINNAQKLALKQQESDMDAPQRKHVLNSDGTKKRWRNEHGEGYVYVKDEHGNDLLFPEESKRNKLKRKLTKLEQQKIKSELELNEAREKVDNTVNMKKLLTKQLIAEENTQQAIKQHKEYIESPDFIAIQNEVENERMKVKKLQTENDINKQKLEQEKRMKTMMAQIEIEKSYNPVETGAAEVMAQFQVLGDKGVEMLKHDLESAQYDNAVVEAREKLERTIDDLLNKYLEGYKSHVRDNMWTLVSHKYENLKENIDDFNLSELTNSTELIKILSNYDLIGDDDAMSEIEAKPDIAGFVWK